MLPWGLTTCPKYIMMDKWWSGLRTRGFQPRHSTVENFHKHVGPFQCSLELCWDFTVDYWNSTETTKCYWDTLQRKLRVLIWKLKILHCASYKVIACVLVVLLVIFLVIGLCFKLAGHKMTWEKSLGNERQQQQRIDEDFAALRGRRTRNASGTSNISGIVFNVNRHFSDLSLLIIRCTYYLGKSASSQRGVHGESNQKARDSR